MRLPRACRFLTRGQHDDSQVPITDLIPSDDEENEYPDETMYPVGVQAFMGLFKMFTMEGSPPDNMVREFKLLPKK